MTKDKLTAQLQEEFDAALPGVVFNFSQYIQDNVEEALSGVKGANSVKIIGPNLNVWRSCADQGHDEMAAGHAAWPISASSTCVGQPNLNIKVDRDKAARYGLNTGDVNTVIQAAMGGAVATHRAGGRSPVQSDCAPAPAISRQHREDRQHQGRLSDRRRDDGLYSVARTGRPSRSIPARPTSTTRPRSATSRSNSACAAATSAAPWPRRRSASPRTSSCRRAIAWSGRASSRT